MTPQERQLVDDLFDRLARLESTQRDPDAERTIRDGLGRAPNALYPLVQTVLLQDEALTRAEARIRELSGEENAPAEQRGFLDSMRDAFAGRRTSVPSIGEPDTRWNRGGAFTAQPGAPAAQPMQSPGFGGGSFLGTAAATAAGVIGGSLLMNSLSGMFGHRGGGSAFADTPRSGGSPWDNNAAGSDLARDAGVNDVGGSRYGAMDDTRSAGLFGNGDDAPDDAGGDFGGDSGGDFGGGDSA